MKAYLRIYRQQKNKWCSKTKSFTPCDPYMVRKCGSDNTVILDNRLSKENLINVAFEVFNKRKKSPLDGFDIIQSQNIREWDKGRVIFNHNINQGTQ